MVAGVASRLECMGDGDTCRGITIEQLDGGKSNATLDGWRGNVFV